MRVVDASGRFLDAKYSAEPDGDFIALIMASRSSRPKRNSEYNQALDILLARLAQLDAVLVDALVDSDYTQGLELPAAKRRIIDRPYHLAAAPDLVRLRKDMGNAQVKVGQAAGASGGNSNKRIRLRLQVPGCQPGDAAQLADAVAIPTCELRSTPGAILASLPKSDSRPPTADEYEAASGLAEDLDKVIRAVRRVEQAYLRRVLFPGTVAPCDLCGRQFAVEFLVAAHVKKRSACTDTERRDLAHVVMAACRFGCDELYERGYVTIAADGALVLSPALDSCSPARAYADQHLADHAFGRPVDGRGGYFGWHRDHVFLSQETSQH